MLSNFQDSNVYIHPLLMLLEFNETLTVLLYIVHSFCDIGKARNDEKSNL